MSAWAPFSGRRVSRACFPPLLVGGNRLEPANGLGDRHLGGQPLQAGGAEEPDHPARPLEHISSVLRLRVRPPSAEPPPAPVVAVRDRAPLLVALPTVV